MPRTPLEDLAATLNSPGDHAALLRIRDRAEEIHAALAQVDGGQVLPDVAFERLAAHHPDWIGEVYEALGAASSDAAEWLDDPVAKALEAERADDIQQTCKAFELMCDSIGPLANWAQVLPPSQDSTRHGRRLVESDHLAAWLNSAGRAARAAVESGLTPLVLASALAQLQLLFDDIVDAADDTSRHRPAWLLPSASPESGLRIRIAVAGRVRPVGVPDEVCVVHVKAARGLMRDLAPRLFDWIVAVLELRPWLIPGWKRDPSTGLLQALAGDDAPTLMQRWTRGAPPRGLAPVSGWHMIDLEPTRRPADIGIIGQPRKPAVS